MKVLCDVHIAYRLVRFLQDQGVEAVHVNRILSQSETPDEDISDYADKHDYIVVTKDSDFRDSYFLRNTPKKLIYAVSI